MVQISVVKAGMAPLTTSYKKIWASNALELKDVYIYIERIIHLTLMGEAKWYLGMRIRQYKNYIILDQDQYVKNIITRFEKQFKHPFKLKDLPLPSSFIPTKKDSPKMETETKEV